MISSVPHNPAHCATASSDEIILLNQFLTPYLNRRHFSKGLSEFHLAVFPPPRKWSTRGPGLRSLKRAPYDYLKAEFEEKLGEREGTLVRRIWQQHGLDQLESDPARLRQALRKLFSTAARLAASKDAGSILKSVLLNFERQYFQVNELPLAPPPPASNQRLGLLALIQTGEGCSLLDTVLSTKCTISVRPNQPNPSPSRRIDDDTTRLRREFLLEAAYRAGDWDLAYRQGRLLKLADSPLGMGLKSKRQFREACRQLLLRGGQPPAKQKQLLVDVAAACTAHATRLEYALRASASTTRTCRSGELELLLCQLLDASDPRWRINLRRLYRQRPMTLTWLSSLRKLWHHEPRLRSYCRVLFSVLRYSREWAESALERNGLESLGTTIQAGQILSRLNRACEVVQRWSAIVGECRVSVADPEVGYKVQLPLSLAQHVRDVCRQLGEVAPVSVRVVTRFEHVEISGAWDSKELLISPSLFNYSEGEAKFILARALFRHVCGLDRLEPMATGLSDLAALAERASAHCEWMGHDRQPWYGDGTGELGIARPSELSYEEVQVALEELYWQTGDATYLKFSKILNSRCWCPQGEFEADTFASTFCDPVSASYAVIASTADCQLIYRQAQRSGLTSLNSEIARRPLLAMRLQNLWMSSHEELQLRCYRSH